MYKRKIQENLDCGLDVAMKVFGGKWNVKIIDCIHNGINRPSTLNRAIDGTSIRVIRLQLKELESYGIVKRDVLSQFPPHVEYSLSRLGLTALGVIDVIDAWGDTHRTRILKNMTV
jgi:DNA-binding HxlR family transcriptional regulator